MRFIIKSATKKESSFVEIGTGYGLIKLSPSIELFIVISDECKAFFSAALNLEVNREVFDRRVMDSFALGLVFSFELAGMRFLTNLAMSYIILISS